MAIKSCNGGMPVYDPIILCGDLNLEPRSRLYDFLLTGSIECGGLYAGELATNKGQGGPQIVGVEQLLPESANVTSRCITTKRLTEMTSPITMRPADAASSRCDLLTHPFQFTSVYR